MFFFIFFSNITEIIPASSSPRTRGSASRWCWRCWSGSIYRVVGFIKQGPLHYLKNSTVPPGVPKAILPLVVAHRVPAIFIVRPFSLAVRLFANMLAGHLILVTFGVLLRGAVGRAASRS